MRWLRRLALGAGLVIVLAPVALLAALRLGSDDTSLAGVTFDLKPVITTATAREILDEKPVKVSLTWQKGAELVAPHWLGTVTAVYAAEGSILKSGEGLVSIDGVDRIALASDPPFYRAISQGDSGKDVRALNSLLTVMGLMPIPPADPETATLATTRAIRSLSEAIGAGPDTTVFDPAWIVWLPANGFPVGSIDLGVGRPAPVAGQLIAEAPASLASAQVSAAGQDALSLDKSSEWVLAVNGNTLLVDPVSLRVNPPALDDLARTLKPGIDATAGTLRRATPLHVLAIPSTAVMTGETGRLCIWTPSGGGYAPGEVTLAGARSGVSNVVSGLKAGEPLLANPAEVLESPQCPSN